MNDKYNQSIEDIKNTQNKLINDINDNIITKLEHIDSINNKIIDSISSLIQDNKENSKKIESIKKARALIKELLTEIANAKSPEDIAKIRTKLNYYINIIKKEIISKNLNDELISSYSSIIQSTRKEVSRKIRLLKRNTKIQEIIKSNNNYSNLTVEKKKELSKNISSEKAYTKRFVNEYYNDDILQEKLNNNSTPETDNKSDKTKETSFNKTNEENKNRYQEMFDALYNEIDTKFFNEKSLEKVYKKMEEIIDKISDNTYRMRLKIVRYSINTLHSYLNDLKNLKNTFVNLSDFIHSYDIIIDKEKDNLLNSVRNFMIDSNKNVAKKIDKIRQERFDYTLDNLQKDEIKSSTLKRYIEHLIESNEAITNEEQKKNNLIIIEQLKRSSYLLSEYEEINNIDKYIEEKKYKEKIDMIISHLNNEKDLLFPPIYKFIKEEINRLDNITDTDRKEQLKFNEIKQFLESNQATINDYNNEYNRLIKINEKINDSKLKNNNDIFIRRINYNIKLVNKITNDMLLAEDHPDQLIELVNNYKKDIEKYKPLLFPTFIKNLDIFLQKIEIIAKKKSTQRIDNPNTSNLLKKFNLKDENEIQNFINIAMKNLNNKLYNLDVYNNTIDDLISLNSKITNEALHHKNGKFIENVRISFELLSTYIREKENSNLNVIRDCQNLLDLFESKITNLYYNEYLLTPIYDFLNKEMINLNSRLDLMKEIVRGL